MQPISCVISFGYTARMSFLNWQSGTILSPSIMCADTWKPEGIWIADPYLETLLEQVTRSLTDLWESEWITARGIESAEDDPTPPTLN